MGKSMVRFAVLAIMITASLSAASCGYSKDEGRQTVEREGRKVTVVNNSSESVYNTKLEVKKTVNIGQTWRGLDWLDEDRFILTQQYGDLDQRKSSPVPENFHNFFVINSNSLKGSDPLSGMEEIKKGDAEIGFLKLSPDGSRIFYIEGTDYNVPDGVAKIMNRITGEVTTIPSDPVKLRNGVWIDHDTIAFITRAREKEVRESIYLYDLDGTKTRLITIEGYFHHINAFNGVLYYVKFSRGDQNENEIGTMDITSNAEHAISVERKHPFSEKVFPSPDGKMLALLKAGNNNKTGQYEMTLSITDLEGRQISQIKSNAMYSVSWTPDGEGILYQRWTLSNSESDGIYLFDVNGGGSTPIELTTKTAVDYSWSPSGKKLLITKQWQQYETTVVYFE